MTKREPSKSVCSEASCYAERSASLTTPESGPSRRWIASTSHAAAPLRFFLGQFHNAHGDGEFMHGAQPRAFECRQRRLPQADATIVGRDRGVGPDPNVRGFEDCFYVVEQHLILEDAA